MSIADVTLVRASATGRFLGIPSGGRGRVDAVPGGANETTVELQQIYLDT
jgi:hypothetical protein